MNRREFNGGIITASVLGVSDFASKTIEADETINNKKYEDILPKLKEVTEKIEVGVNKVIANSSNCSFVTDIREYNDYPGMELYSSIDVVQKYIYEGRDDVVNRCVNIVIESFNKSGLNGNGCVVVEGCPTCLYPSELEDELSQITFKIPPKSNIKLACSRAQFWDDPTIYRMGKFGWYGLVDCRVLSCDAPGFDEFVKKFREERV